MLRVGFDTLIYMLLALGLNIVVGFAGLLDLGYIAFFGFGAYGYAMLASSQFHLHWPTLAILPLVTAATVLLGFLVALPSRRLVGDYLAIVTLFFGQLFVTVTNNGESMSLLGLTRDVNVTNGPNGIANIDAFHLFGHSLESLAELLLRRARLLPRSCSAPSTSSATRASAAPGARCARIPLAAELMGMPVNRLKLQAFAFGAGVAGLTGTLFASLNTAVFSSDFDTPTLITVYAILILGGAGSLGGVILGALVVNISLEVLRTPGHATIVFFALIGATLLAKLRPWRTLAAVIAATIALGFAVRAVAGAIWPFSPAHPGRRQRLARHGARRLAAAHRQLPASATTPSSCSSSLVLALTTVQRPWRTLLLPPTLCLAAFDWDARLAFEPSTTRLIFVGVILIVLMNARPQGLLGAARVEIV